MRQPDRHAKEDLAQMGRLQGVPPLFIQAIREHGAFTATALKTGIGNGVPLAMGRAVAKAVKAAVNIHKRERP